MLKALILGLSLVSLQAEAQSLNLSVGPNPAQILPVTVQTCSDPQQLVSGPMVEFTNLNFQWTGERDLLFSTIQVDIQSPDLKGGKYTCVIQGEELKSILGPAANAVIGGDSTVYRSNCSVRCGSIPVKYSVFEAQFEATVSVQGIETDNMALSYPVHAEQKVKLNYSRP